MWRGIWRAYRGIHVYKLSYTPARERRKAKTGAGAPKRESRAEKDGFSNSVAVGLIAQVNLGGRQFAYEFFGKVRVRQVKLAP
jgi:hypothetical protein